jgi:hypothetical protein
MNRSILIVICDFLLLSLLTFSTDINRMADENTQPPTKVVVATNSPVNAGADLAAVMQRALQDERASREQLQQQFAQIRGATTQQQAQLGEREQENLRLQRQFAASQTNVENLGSQLQAVSAQAQMSQQQLTVAQKEAHHDSQLIAALHQQLESLALSNLLAQTEKQRLGNELQLAEVEQRDATERATMLQQEVQAAHAENTELAKGFQTLATNSSQLTQEIQANTALAPNTIFSKFVSNRVEAGMIADRSSWYGGDLSKNKNVETVLVTDGTNIFALCHVQDTPLTLWDPGTDWDKFTGTITWQSAHVPIHSLSFDGQDPRVVMIPVSPADAARLGCKVFRISSDPYRFQDAVLVGTDEGYYGECNFQIDLDTRHYVRLDRSLLKGLFGKFNPSRGDLVFSRTGDLLGIMVNNTYCLTIHNFAAAATIPFNEDLHNRHTGGLLSQLYNDIVSLPLQLQ